MIFVHFKENKNRDIRRRNRHPAHSILIGVCDINDNWLEKQILGNDYDDDDNDEEEEEQQQQQ